jgi:hypothetical protein
MATVQELLLMYAYMKSSIVWDIMPRGMVKIGRRSGGVYRHMHYQEILTLFYEAEEIVTTT